MQSRLLFLILIFIGGLTVRGQTYLSSDRPGQTYSAAVLGQDSFQVQAGLERYRLQWPSSSGQNPADRFAYFPRQDNGLLSTFDLRYGLLEGLELMLSSQVLGQDRSYWDGPTVGVIGLPPEEPERTIAASMQLGLRQSYPLSEHFQLGFLTRAEVLATDKWFEWRPLWAWNVSPRFSLSGNLALAYHENSLLNYRGSYTLNGAFAMQDSWGLFLEHFGNIWFQGGQELNVFQPALDGGTYWYLLPNLMFDLTLTYGRYEVLDFLAYNQPNNYWSAALGLSWRIP